MHAVIARLSLLALLVGCGFTDRQRERPGDLGVGPDGPADAARDQPADGPTDTGPPECLLVDAGDSGVPAGWVCDPSVYGEGECDCGCGVADPDCGGQGCCAEGCCDPATCFALGCLYCGILGDPCFPADGGGD
jgi:hypothetical protein